MMDDKTPPARPGAAALQWLMARLAEPSTWAGLAMVAVVLGSDPRSAVGLAEAISLIIGGGLMGHEHRRAAQDPAERS